MSDDCIYAVEHPDGFYKVGRSKNPYDRVSQIQVGSPYDLEFRFALMYWPGQIDKDAERVAHDRLQEYSVGGEWFEVSKSTLLRVLHDMMDTEGIQGYRIYDIERRRERENSRKKRHERLNRRPKL